MKISNLAVRFLAVVVLASAVGLGQTQPDQSNGFKPWGSYDGGNLDSVSLEDGNFLLHAPVVPASPQRGKPGPQFMMYMSSKNWGEQCDVSSGNGALFNCFWAYGGTGVRFELSAQMSVRRQVQIVYDVNLGTEY